MFLRYIFGDVELLSFHQSMLRTGRTVQARIKPSETLE